MKKFTKKQKEAIENERSKEYVVRAFDKLKIVRVTNDNAFFFEDGDVVAAISEDSLSYVALPTTSIKQDKNVLPKNYEFWWLHKSDCVDATYDEITKFSKGMTLGDTSRTFTIGNIYKAIDLLTKRK